MLSVVRNRFCILHHCPMTLQNKYVKIFGGRARPLQGPPPLDMPGIDVHCILCSICVCCVRPAETSFMTTQPERFLDPFGEHARKTGSRHLQFYVLRRRTCILSASAIVPGLYSPAWIRRPVRRPRSWMVSVLSTAFG